MGNKIFEHYKSWTKREKALAISFMLIFSLASVTGVYGTSTIVITPATALVKDAGGNLNMTGGNVTADDFRLSNGTAFGGAATQSLPWTNITATTQQPYSYLIGVFSNSSYYAVNGTDGQYIVGWTSTNASLVINNATQLGNQTVVISSGTFDGKGTNILLAQNTVLKGSGRDLTFLHNFTIKPYNGLLNQTIQDLTIQNATDLIDFEYTVGGGVIKTLDLINLRLLNAANYSVTVVNTPYKMEGCFISGSTNCSLWHDSIDSLILNSQFYNNNGRTAYLSGGDNIIENCMFAGHSTNNAQLYLDDAPSLLLNNIWFFDSATYAIKISDADSGYGTATNIHFMDSSSGNNGTFPAVVNAGSSYWQWSQIWFEPHTFNMWPQTFFNETGGSDYNQFCNIQGKAQVGFIPEFGDNDQWVNCLCNNTNVTGGTPIPVVPGTVGNTAILLSELDDENRVEGAIFQMPATGNLYNITAYMVGTGSFTRNCKASLYNANTLAKIAETEERSISFTTSAGWQTFTFASPVNVASGTNIILCCSVENGAGETHLFYGSGTSNQFAYQDIGYPTLPDPMSPSYLSFTCSIYANYTESG